MSEETPFPALPPHLSTEEGVSSPFSPDVWVPALRRVIPRTRLLRVPAGSAFLPYLLDDAVVVPDGDPDSGAPQPGDDVFSEEALAASRTAGSSGCPGGGGSGNGNVCNGSLANGVAGHLRNGGGSGGGSSTSGDSSSGSDSDCDPRRPPVACPPDIMAAITAALADMGTDVSPKFGGRCPTDAGWVSFHRSPRSSSAADVLLLFKSSERVAAAVADAVAAASSSSSAAATTAAAGLPPPPMWLHLRAWVDMSAGVEVRAFVMAGRVVALCTRGDAGGAGGAGLRGGGGGGGLLATEDGKRQVVSAVEHLWATTVAAALHVDALVLDVYVDGSGRGWVVDVAPADEDAGVDALLFTWVELRTMTGAAAATAAAGDEWHPWLRCAAEGGDAPSLAPSRALYDGVPLELRQPGSAAALVAAATDMVNREREDAQQGR